MTRRAISILTVSILLATFAAEAQAAQDVALTVGPATGVAPFEADIRVVAVGPDDDTQLICELDFGDVRDGEPDIMRFTLQSPWPAQAVFPHTYDYSGTFTPEVSCVGGGTTGDLGQIIIAGQAGNRAPQADLVVTPTTGSASIARTITVRNISDADGDTLDCFVDFDVIDDFNFSGDEQVHTFTVAPPYNDVQIQHNWDVARNFTPNLACVDGRGGRVTDSQVVSISPVSGNSAPTVAVDRQFPFNSEPGVVRRFRARTGDADGDTLRCQFRALWSDPRQYFTVSPPYDARFFERVFKTFGSHLQAYLLCVDPDGAMSVANRGFEIETFPTENGFPVLLESRANPEDGSAAAGLEVQFAVTAFDPDGDALSCDVDFGEGQGGTTISIPASRQGTPVDVTHTYDSRGSYGARVQCDDGGLEDEADYAWVHVYEEGKRFPTVDVEADPSNGGGLLPVTLTLAIDDPDGQPLDCTFSYGSEYAGGGVIPEDISFTIEPPYEPVVLETIYRGTHLTELNCMDPTGRAHDSEAWIQINAFNQTPIVDSFQPNKSASINDTLFAVFNIDVSDPNLDERIDCEVDFGDGAVLPFLRFEFPDYQSLNVSHLYQARTEPYEAVIRCDDNEGATAEALQTIEVGVAANRPPQISVLMDPAYGHVPFDTTIRIDVNDPNAFEGDSPDCVLDLGDGSPLVAFDPNAPVEIHHVYRAATVYHPTVTCTDDFGATTTVEKLAVATRPGTERSIGGVDVGR